MKKVLGIVISERRLGNSELLVKEIMESVPEPCQREMIRLTDLKIESCRACYRCLVPGTACSINDDFNFVTGKIKECDALIIGMPVYFLGPHGYFKMFTDRMLGVGHYADQTRGKPCVMVIPYGAQGWEGYTGAAALVLPRVLELKLLDCWKVHATLPGEGLLSNQNRENARKLGLKLFTAKEEYPKGQWECQHCGSDLFRLLPDGMVECPLCSARGQLKAEGIQFSTTHSRFSREGLEEHFKGWLVEMKEKYMTKRETLKEVQKPYRGKNWWIKPDK